jgi:uncharacterized membrane protein YbhN (UPF0104 family)
VSSVLPRLLLAAGAVLLLVLVYRLGAADVAGAMSRIAWWQFALICLLQGVNVAIDTYGWQCVLGRDRASFRRLLAARCAGDAANVLTAVASVGGEALKAWLLRREIPYEESVPSLIVSKTAEVVAQTLLLAVGLLVASLSDAVGPGLRSAMGYLLVVEVIAVAGFVAVQVAGVVGRAGRAFRFTGRGGSAERLDDALRTFYREELPRFSLSVVLYFAGWMIGAVQALITVGAAIVIEALWSGVRFVTFFIPASLGTLEGANAAAFRAFAFAASAGLAFTLVRRACQAVWIALGVVILLAMRPARPPAPVAQAT